MGAKMKTNKSRIASALPAGDSSLMFAGIRVAN
jgi:hypothetical protein